jgi:hypothetical protein
MVRSTRTLAALAAAAAALVVTPAPPAAAYRYGVPASAATADSCTLGSPNIVRDVTDCVAYLTQGCSPLGSPNIITDILECLRA